MGDTINGTNGTTARIESLECGYRSIETKLDHIVDGQIKLRERVEVYIAGRGTTCPVTKQLVQICERLEEVERWQVRMTGAISVVVGIFTIVCAYLLQKV
jgi:hypothetical protein